MVVEHYDPANLSELVPKLGLKMEAELCQLRLLSDDAIFNRAKRDMRKHRRNSAGCGTTRWCAGWARSGAESSSSSHGCVPSVVVRRKPRHRQRRWHRYRQARTSAGFEQITVPPMQPRR